MHNTSSSHDTESSVKAGYEVTDMNARLIAYFLAGLMFLMFGACIAIIMVIRGFDESRASLNATPGSPLAVPAMQIPDEPRLQLDPVADRKKLEAENQQQIDSYGVVSEEPGMERVHIPVNRAIELLAEGKGVYRQEPKPAALAPEADPFAEGAL